MVILWLRFWQKQQTSNSNMATDAAIIAGVRKLWKQRRLFDCTIVVEDRLIRAHKVILSSVSNYFQHHLTRRSNQGHDTSIHVGGITVTAMESLVDFIYKGNMKINIGNVVEILDGAYYLEMPTAIDVCSEYLMAHLNKKTCHAALITFKKHAVEDKIKAVSSFIVENIPQDELQSVIGKWCEAEVDLFFHVKKWIEADQDNRKKRLNDLMAQIRFGLMTPAELRCIQKTKMYKESFGLWRRLVDEALEYHNLPIHCKVLSHSEQSSVRSEPAPTCFTTESSDLCLYTLDTRKEWRIAEKLTSPDDCNEVVAAVEINNFLIVSPEDADKGQEWFVFDPRSMSWSQLASMGVCKEDFTVVYNNGQLYVLGGVDPDIGGPVLAGAEKFDFETNVWSVFVPLPYPVMRHSSCVFNNTIYISGGHHGKCDSDSDEHANTNAVDNPKLSAVISLDLSDPTWQRKAPMLQPRSRHAMFVMKLKAENVICVLNKDFQPDYYSPATNQWSALNYTFSSAPPQLTTGRTVFTKGNAVFFYDNYRDGKCLILTYPEEGETVVVRHLSEHFSLETVDDEPELHAYGAMLTVPAHKVTEPTRDTIGCSSDDADESYEDCYPEYYYEETVDMRALHRYNVGYDNYY